MAEEMKQIRNHFARIASGKQAFTKSEFKKVTVGICELSLYCNGLLFDKIVAETAAEERLVGEDGADRVSLSMFARFWAAHFSQRECAAFRLVRLLASSKRDYLERKDFVPLIEAVLAQHPGLGFLRESAEFHSYYISTVIARIFYHIDSSKDGRITVRELRRSNFLDILDFVDTECDINEIFDYFSYEHFYVIYSKFWELDEDEDHRLSKEDLLKYEDYALTAKVVERVIAGSAQKAKGLSPPSDSKKEMEYEEFVDFIISEQDKTNAVSIRYWFRVLDLDGDGVLSPYELELFYAEQAAKIERVCGESIPFQNVLDLLNDMIAPKEQYRFTLRDLKSSKMAGPFFNTLFNIHKFGAEESDRLPIHQREDGPAMTRWERYASAAYAELSRSQIS